MNLYGVGGVTQGLVLPQQEAPRRPESERAAIATARPSAAPAVAPAAVPGRFAPAGPALQADAPTGTDPELWSVLAPDERAFFARVGGMGPLTYSHMIHSGQPTTAVVRGGRIDVRA